MYYSEFLKQGALIAHHLWVANILLMKTMPYFGGRDFHTASNQKIKINKISRLGLFLGRCGTQEKPRFGSQIGVQLDLSFIYKARSILTYFQ